MTTISDLTNVISTVRSDPSAIQRKVLDLLEAVSGGELVTVDPSNPFALGLEMAVSLAHNTLIENTINTRKLYPSLASNREELYLHMSDYDYKDIFSTPSRADIYFVFGKEEVMSKTIADPNLPGSRRFTIPRNFKVTVQGMEFTLLYPIDIKVVHHSGLLVTYDYSEPTTLQPLATNIVPMDFITIDEIECIRLKVSMLQLNVDRYTAKMSASSGFTSVYKFTDQFHYCRAFIPSGDGWKEIKTTHTNRVYDPNVPTLSLQLLDTGLRVTVPQLYYNNGMITDVIRIDIYTTKGKLDVNLEQVEHTEYKGDFNNAQDEVLDKYSAQMQTFHRFMMYSLDTVSGGTNGISFDALRNKVITRSISTEGLPITRNQITYKLDGLGYKLVTNIDNITDRQFLATRRPPAHPNLKTVNGISAVISVLQETMVNLELSRYVVRNGIRDTIKPGMLFEYIDNKLQVVNNEKVKGIYQLKQDNPEVLANTLNKSNYLFNPYYYVIDSNVDELTARVYHFDNPQITSRFFIQMKDALSIKLTIAEHAIRPAESGDGFVLSVLLDLGEEAKVLGPDFIGVQLSYQGRNSQDGRYFLTGKLVSPIDEKTGKPVNDDYIYQFHIETKYDVDTHDGLILTPYKTTVGLEHEFDIVTIIKDYNPDGVGSTAIDNLINPEKLPNYTETSSYSGVSHERLKLKFGDRLNHLWNRTRTVLEYDRYEVYEHDVIDYFEEDVYELSSTGTPKLIIDKETDTARMKVLHRKGDRKIDKFGDTVYKHRKGDVVLDEHGDPVLKQGGRGLERHIDLFLLDARYLFVDVIEDINYRKKVVNEVVNWCVNDMGRVNDQLIERSEIFYYPIRTTGEIEVLADNNLSVSISAEQKFNVSYFLTQEKFKNNSLKESIKVQTRRVIQSVLTNPTVSIDRIIDSLRVSLGSNIVGVNVTGFLDDKYSTVTLKDNSMGLTIGKKLSLLSTNQLEIIDDINIDFEIHGEI